MYCGEQFIRILAVITWKIEKNTSYCCGSNEERFSTVETGN